MTGNLFKLLLLVAAVLLTNLATAQGSVTGTVTDVDGIGLPGASVIVKGTNSGTVTDFDGVYTLDNVDDDAILIFSFTGFVNQEIPVASNSVIDVELGENTTVLDEVVVVGYGTQSRESLTTAVSSVSSEEITAIPVASVDQALEGRAAGVQVRGGGSPGENSTVSIRGLNTFGDGSPLFVVDGIFVTDLTEINPASIEKVDVLKDAAAAAIYGSRGSNGVVIITTKSGSNGKAKLSLDAQSGFQYLPESKYYDLINTDQMIDLVSSQDVQLSQPGNSLFDGNDSPPRLYDTTFVPANTDFQDEIYQVAPINKVDLNVSGGSDFVKYNFGAGVFDQEGIQIDTEFRRYSVNLNTEFRITNAIKIGQTLNTGFSRFKTPEQDGGASLQEWAFRSYSYLPTRTPEGLLQSASRNQDFIEQNATSPLVVAFTQENQTRRATILGSVFAEVELLPGLRNRFQVGANYSNTVFNAQRDRTGDGQIIGSGARSNKETNKNRNVNGNYTLTNVLSYNKSFGNTGHNFDASYIFERFDNTFEATRIAYQSATDENSVTELPTVTGDQLTVTTERFPEVLLSHAGRVGYNYQGKYILSASLRRDATSKFTDPVGIFPAGSIAWVASKESFLNGSGIDNLKLRASYGVSGNNRVPVFSNRAALVPTFSSVIGDEIVTGIAPASVDSRNLTWETSEKSNIGFDLGLIDNRLKFTFDYFNSASRDLIVVPPTDVSRGISINPPVNSADVDSRGYEVTLGYGDYDDNDGFTWDVWASLSHVKPEVKRISANIDQILGVTLNSLGNADQSNIIAVGEPLYAFYGYKTDDLFRSVDEVIDGPFQNQVYLQASTGVVLSRVASDAGGFVFTTEDGTVVERSDVTLDQGRGTGVGDYRYVDADGDGDIDSDDRVVIGNPNPDFTYSLNLNAGYRRFDFNLFLTGVEGVDAYNFAINPVGTYFGVRNFRAEVLDRYSADNPNSNVERYSAIDPNNNRRISDKFVEDGSYLRIKNVTLGYTIPTGNIARGAISKLRLYASAQNILTLTEYSGFDPEIRPSYNSSGIVEGIGIDRGFAPLPTSFLFGVQVGF